MSNFAKLFELAVAHHQRGDLAQAEALYRQLVGVDPHHADARHLLGLVAHQAGNHEAAISLIQSAIALNPASLYLSNLGLVFKALGRRDEAIACFRQAVERRPDHAEAWENLGAALREQGSTTEAVYCFRQALRIYPSRAETHNNLGAALQELGQRAEAVDCYEQALRLDPTLNGARANLAGAANSHGAALLEQGENAEAILYLRRALAADPTHAHAHNNLGVALKDMSQLDEAVASFERSLQLEPANVDATNNLGLILEWLGRRDEARALYEETLRIDPGQDGTRFNRGLLRLLEGDFEGGWPDYELRLKLPGALAGQNRLPRWDGSSFADKSLLVRAEQGLGDAIQFARYVPLVKQRGGRVIFECHGQLVNLFKCLPGPDEVIAMGTAWPPCDFQVPLHSLPLLLGTTSLATIPAMVPYLSADGKRLAHWKQEIQEIDGFKVGVAWQGNPDNAKDRYRSLPLARLEPLAKLRNVKLISLQVGHGTEQLAAVPFPVVDLGGRFDPKSLSDLAAALMNMDLVIAVESAVAHLAGALGAPVWTLLAQTPDWRWLLDRTDSPWYPTMRLFRQSRFGDWDDLIARVAEALAERFA